MRSRLNSVRLVSGFALAGFVLLAAGCQSSDVLGGGNDAPKPPTEKVLESELRAYCPPVVLREGTAFYRTYAKGGKDDAAKLIYQASLGDVTRDCKRDAGTGMMTITVAVAGKVVTGPAGGPGTIRMPIRVAAVRGEEVLYSKLHTYELNVGSTPGATQFLFKDPAVVIPIPSPGTIQVFAGFDEGPYDTK